MKDSLFDNMRRVENGHWWFVTRRKIIGKVMDKFCPDKHARIFDVGCGTGDNLGFLAAHGRVTAMEKHDTALAYARARNIGNVYEGNLPDGIPDEVGGDYDIIVMFDVLEHIEDDARCLSILLEHAKGKGKLILTVPAYRFLWSNHDIIHHHKRRYTSANLRKALEANGWRVNYISYFNTLLFPAALIVRIMEKFRPPEGNAELTMPPIWLNTILKNIFQLECHFIGSVSLPFGLSIIAVAEKA